MSEESPEGPAGRAAFLAEVSRVLASSLDYRATLTAVARLAVPTVADWCAIDVLSTDGEIERLAVAYVDPRTATLGQELLERYPLRADAKHGVPNVVRTSEPELYTELPARLRAHVGSAADESGVGHRLESAMVVPLLARGRVLGAITLISAESGRHYGRVDLALAEELAHRAALAVDNARLYGTAEERRRVAEELARFARSLTASLDLHAVAERTVVGVLPVFDAAISMLRVVEPDGSLTHLAHAGQWGDVVPSRVLAPGSGVMGRAAATGVPSWSRDVAADPGVRLGEDSLATVARTGLHALLAVPLRVGDAVLGALAVGCRAARAFTETETALLQAFADQAALAIRNVQLFEREQAARAQAESIERRTAFLAGVSALLASTLEYDETLNRLANLVVPRLADFCIIDVLGEDGRIHRMATAHGRPHTDAGVAHLRDQFAPDVTSDHPVASVLRRGKPEIVSEMTDAVLARIARGPEHLAVARALGYTSYIVVPLVARSRTLGTLSLISAESGRRYTTDDLDLAEELAARAALAVDNARLYSESEARRRAAEALAETGRVLSQTLDVEAVAERAAANVRDLIGGTTAVVYRLDPITGEMSSLGVSGDTGSGFGTRFTLPPDVGIVGVAMREGRPVATANLLADARIHLPEDVRVKLLDAPHRAALAVPLIVQERAIGALLLGDRAGRTFTPDEVHLAQSFADQAAIALENARLFEEATLRRRAEQAARAEAEAASRAKDEFLATLSHELRTPLTAMLGWARALRTAPLDDGTRERALDSIERNTWTQAQLINDLLDISRIITGKLRLDVRPVELAPVVHAAMDTVRPAADAKRIVLTFAVDAALDRVAGDPDRLQQVVWNLLSNAIKFTPGGGRVEVRLTGDDAAIALSVHDTGQGIAPDFLPHVFDRFRQADGSTTRRFGGLGLGLAIVRQLVELHGGTVDASSAGEGQGAAFTVRLPVMPIVSPAAAEAVVARISVGDRRRHLPALDGQAVLVVEDDEDTREMIVTVLAQCGANVTAVGSVAEAIDALGRGRLDVIVADIGMPAEDGYALMRRVRARPDAVREIPAVAVTAYARHEDRDRAIAAGYDLHMAKPIDPLELCRMLAAVASGASARRR